MLLNEICVTNIQHMNVISLASYSVSDLILYIKLGFIVRKMQNRPNNSKMYGDILKLWFYWVNIPKPAESVDGPYPDFSLKVPQGELYGQSKQKQLSCADYTPEKTQMMI